MTPNDSVSEVKTASGGPKGIVAAATSGKRKEGMNAPPESPSPCFSFEMEEFKSLLKRLEEAKDRGASPSAFWAAEGGKIERSMKRIETQDVKSWRSPFLKDEFEKIKSSMKRLEEERDIESWPSWPLAAALGKIQSSARRLEERLDPGRSPPVFSAAGLDWIASSVERLEGRQGRLEGRQEKQEERLSRMEQRLVLVGRNQESLGDGSSVRGHCKKGLVKKMHDGRGGSRRGALGGGVAIYTKLVSVFAVLLLAMVCGTVPWGGAPSSAEWLVVKVDGDAGQSMALVLEPDQRTKSDENIASARALAVNGRRVLLRPSSSRGVAPASSHGVDRRLEGNVAENSPMVDQKEEDVTNPLFHSPASVAKKVPPRLMIADAAAALPAVASRPTSHDEVQQTSGREDIDKMKHYRTNHIDRQSLDSRSDDDGIDRSPDDFQSASPRPTIDKLFKDSTATRIGPANVMIAQRSSSAPVDRSSPTYYQQQQEGEQRQQPFSSTTPARTTPTAMTSVATTPAATTTAEDSADAFLLPFFPTSFPTSEPTASVAPTSSSMPTILWSFPTYSPTLSPTLFLTSNPTVTLRPSSTSMPSASPTASSIPTSTAMPSPAPCVDSNCVNDSCDACCTPQNKCAVGEGGCNSDEDCLPGLQCARENCRSEFGWVNGNDSTNCCVDYCEEEIPFYRGSTNKQSDGSACSRWDHPIYNPENYPYAKLEENFCREPEETRGQHVVWCYYKPDEVRPIYLPGFCDVPTCPCRGADPEIWECPDGPSPVQQTSICTPNDETVWHDFATDLDPEHGSVVFAVKASNTAYIALGPSSMDCGIWNCASSDNYLVQIGYQGNSASELLVQIGNISATMDESLGSVLNRNEFRKFRINWDSYGLKVERYLDSTGWSGFMQVAFKSLKVVIEHAMVMTFGGSTGVWTHGVTCPSSTPTSITASPGSTSGSQEISCEDFNPEVCGCSKLNQADYRGPISITGKGLNCQRWADTAPHNHAYTPANYPNEGLDGSECRNPDRDPRGPWCFTTNPTVEWGYCEVPACLSSGKIDPNNFTLINIGDASGAESESDDGSRIISHNGTIWGLSYLHTARGRGGFLMTISIEEFATEFDNYEKAGLMIRETLDFGSRYIFFYIKNVAGSTGRVDVGVRIRTLTGGDNEDANIEPFSFGRDELRLGKFGDVLKGFAKAETEKEWTLIFSHAINFENFYVGIAVSSQPLGTCGLGEKGDGFCSDGRCCSHEGFCGGSVDYCNGIGDLDPAHLPSNMALRYRKIDALTWLDDGTASKINDLPMTLTNVGAALGAKIGPSSSFDNDSKNWMLVSASKGISDGADEFSFLHSFQTVGDCFVSVLIEEFNNIQTGEKGLMIRETLDPGSRHVFLYLDDSGQIGLSTRESTGQMTKEHEIETNFPSNGLDSLRLKKIGNEVTLYTKATENEWTSITSFPVGFESFCVGIALASRSSNVAVLEFRDFHALTWPRTTISNTRNALLSLYDATGGASWKSRTGWAETDNYCDWHGVSCNTEGELTVINLSNNNLAGPLKPSRTSYFYGMELDSLHHLENIDLSHNSLTGEADILLSPAVRVINLSHNKFTSIAEYTKSKQSHKTLEVLDLSRNNIEQDVTNVLTDIPPNLKQLLLSDNKITGSLPNPFPTLAAMEKLVMDDNELAGQLPDRMHLSLPALKELSLSNQALSGTIPEDLLQTRQLRVLNLSKNNITGTIPSLQVDTNLEELDLAHNALEGPVSGSLADVRHSVLLVKNPGLLNPSPLSLCTGETFFDLFDDPKACPPERSFLTEIYHEMGGDEWTESTSWNSEHVPHCEWFGVKCHPTNISTSELVLHNNGLSRKLSPRIAELRYLTKLDMTDNDIRGSIPSEIGLLSNLKHLGLSYNSFIGITPTELGNLSHLGLVHLHGNRIQGKISLKVPNSGGESSFVADCGVPTDFDDALVCDDCTMCCNANGDCEPRQKTLGEKIGLGENVRHLEFSGIFSASLFVLFGLVTLGSKIYERKQVGQSEAPQSQLIQGQTPARRPSIVGRDELYAVDTIGTDSVYSFFLSESLRAWTIDLAVIGLQTWTLFEFITAAELDFSDDSSAFVYSWKCPRDSETCRDETDYNWQGWVLYGVMMVAHLLADFISGIKLLILAGKQRHSPIEKMRFFIGGSSLCFVSALTIFASTVYNFAIAKSNPDIIVNSILILFITDIDEKSYKLLRVINKGWVDKLKAHQNTVAARSNTSTEEERNKALQDDVEELKREVARLASLLEEKNEGRTENQSSPVDGTRILENLVTSMASDAAEDKIRSIAERLLRRVSMVEHQRLNDTSLESSIKALIEVYTSMKHNEEKDTISVLL